MTDTLNQAPTTTAAVVSSTELHVSETLTIEKQARDLAERVGHLRNHASLINNDVAEVHHQTLHGQLDAHIASLVTRSPTDLLDELAEMGFAWRDIARMVGVSVPALRRWRNGDLPTGENRRAIAKLLAFVQIIGDDHLIFEPASWMEVPIVSGAPTTPIDLYTAGHLDAVFDLATKHHSPEQTMDAIEPDWRERYRSDWGVDTADDGQPYLRLKPGR